MLVAGDWTDGAEAILVISPYDNNEIGTVPRAKAAQIKRAVGYAAAGAKTTKKTFRVL